MQDKHAKEIVVMQVSRLTAFTNYFVICTADSLTQAKAIAEEAASRRPKGAYLGKEGFPESSWVLLDFGQFILHIFSPEARSFYGLERIWADAPRQEFGTGRSAFFASKEKGFAK